MDISDWRQQIDSLDEQITAMLNQRAAAAIEIGKLKAANAAAIYEPKREQQVYAHVSAVNPGPLTNTELNDIYQRIMDVMRNKQRFDKQQSR